MRYYVTAIAIIICDQLVKYETRQALAPGESIPVIGNFFAITHVVNSGAAFGMLAGRTGFLILFSGALIIAMIAILAYILKKQSLHWSARLAAVMIVAGGIGNMIDRVLFGSVTDMFAFSIFPPVFNVADIFVTTGCAFLILYVILGERTKQE